jgi:hypothetical protein
MRYTAILLTLALVAGFVPGAEAQTSSLSGQILDQDGQPVVGAQVYFNQWGQYPADEAPPEEGKCDANGTCTVSSRPYYEGQSNHQEAKSDANGRYSFAANDGWADISANKEGHASAYQGIDVSGTTTLDLKMLKYPAKDAHIEGRITTGGATVRYTAISIDNPVYGTYECSSNVDDERQYEQPRPVEAMPASDTAEANAEAGPDGQTTESPSGDAQISIAPGEYYPYSGCAIKINADGTFSGNVTPGYSIIRVYADSWRDEDRTQYYSVSRVVDLRSGETNRVDVDLVAKPGPDAKLRGYVLDAATGKAVPGARISFNNQDSYGWASAVTDKDGSYSVALRHGYTQLSLGAEGHLPWEGQLTLAGGDSRRMDVSITAGQQMYGGGCCYAYAESGDASVSAPRPAAAPGAPSDGDKAGGAATEQSSTTTEGQTGFEDYGGGLGPYSPEPDAESVPGFEFAAMILGLAALVFVVRRKND